MHVPCLISWCRLAVSLLQFGRSLLLLRAGGMLQLLLRCVIKLASSSKLSFLYMLFKLM